MVADAMFMEIFRSRQLGTRSRCYPCLNVGSGGLQLLPLLETALDPRKGRIEPVSPLELRQVRVWDAEKGTETAAFRGPDPSLGAENSLGLAVSPADGRIAFGGADNAVFLWDPGPSGGVQHLRGHTGQVRALAFSPDGRRLASASEDGALKVWKTADGRLEKHLRGHTGGVTGVAFRPDGVGLVSGSEDGTVKVWDLSPGRDLFHLRLVGWGFRVRFAPDGRRTAIAQFRGVKVPGADGGGPGFDIPQPENAGGVTGLDYSRDGRLLATCSELSHQVFTWDAETGRPAARCQGHAGRVRNVAFGAGKTLASAGDDGTVRTWDAATGRAERVLQAHKGSAFGVAFDPAGRKLATIGWDGAVRLWDARTGEPIRTLGSTLQRESNNYGDALAFDPAGRRLAAASGDGSVRVWEVATGREVLTLRGHSQKVNSVAYSPDGRRLATCAEDRTIKLCEQGRLLHAADSPGGSADGDERPADSSSAGGGRGGSAARPAVDR
jgi:WD40 repeat protein